MLRRSKNPEIEKELQKEAARDNSLRAKHPQENGAPPRLPSPRPAKSSAPVSEPVRLRSVADGPRSLVAPPKENTESKWKASPFSKLQLFTLILKDSNCKQNFTIQGILRLFVFKWCFRK